MIHKSPPHSVTLTMEGRDLHPVITQETKERDLLMIANMILPRLMMQIFTQSYMVAGW